MYNLDILVGEMPILATKKEIFQRKSLIEATEKGKMIFLFQVKNEIFALPELSVGQMLAISKKNAENALFSLFLAYNTRIPKGLDEKKTELMIQIVTTEQQGKTTHKKQPENAEKTLCVSVAMMVKHLGFSWGDILDMSVSQFRMIAENAEVIAGIKKPDNADNSGDEVAGIEGLKHIFG